MPPSILRQLLIPWLAAFGESSFLSAPRYDAGFTFLDKVDAIIIEIIASPEQTIAKDLASS